MGLVGTELNFQDCTARIRMVDNYVFVEFYQYLPLKCYCFCSICCPYYIYIYIYYFITSKKNKIWEGMLVMIMYVHTCLCHRITLWLRVVSPNQSGSRSLRFVHVHFPGPFRNVSDGQEVH